MHNPPFETREAKRKPKAANSTKLPSSDGERQIPSYPHECKISTYLSMYLAIYLSGKVIYFNTPNRKKNTDTKRREDENTRRMFGLRDEETRKHKNDEWED